MFPATLIPRPMASYIRFKWYNKVIWSSRMNKMPLDSQNAPSRDCSMKAIYQVHKYIKITQVTHVNYVINILFLLHLSLFMK